MPIAVWFNYQITILCDVYHCKANFEIELFIQCYMKISFKKPLSY